MPALDQEALLKALEPRVKAFRAAKIGSIAWGSQRSGLALAASGNFPRAYKDYLTGTTAGQDQYIEHLCSLVEEAE